METQAFQLLVNKIDRIESQLDEHKNEVRSDLLDVKNDLKSLNIWRWQVVGAQGVVAGFIALVVTVFVQKYL